MKQPTTEQILRACCHDGEPDQFDFETPFYYDGCTWATDKSILARVTGSFPWAPAGLLVPNVSAKWYAEERKPRITVALPGPVVEPDDVVTTFPDGSITTPAPMPAVILEAEGRSVAIAAEYAGMLWDIGVREVDIADEETALTWRVGRVCGLLMPVVNPCDKGRVSKCRGRWRGLRAQLREMPGGSQVTTLTHAPGKAIEALNLHLTRDRVSEGWQWYDVPADVSTLRAVLAEFPTLKGAECGMWHRDVGDGDDRTQFIIGVEGVSSPFIVDVHGNAGTVDAAAWSAGLAKVIRASVVKRLREQGVVGKTVRRFKERRKR